MLKICVENYFGGNLHVFFAAICGVSVGSCSELLEENSARTVVGKIGWTCGTCHWSQSVQPWPVHDIGTGVVLGSRWWVFLIQPFVGGCIIGVVVSNMFLIFTPIVRVESNFD